MKTLIYLKQIYQNFAIKLFHFVSMYMRQQQLMKMPEEKQNVRGMNKSLVDLQFCIKYISSIALPIS